MFLEIRVHLFTMKSMVIVVLAFVALAAAAPQREGAAFTKEAIKQAQSTFLIPKDAEIQKVTFHRFFQKSKTHCLKNHHQNCLILRVLSWQVQEGIELAAYESIPGNQRINLFEILGDQVPSEVINNLQGQIDQVGRQ